MKIKTSVVVALATSFLATQSFANGYCLNTNKCSGFPSKWRWKAVAQVYNVGIPQIGNGITCNASYKVSAQKQNGCAFQYSANQGGAWSFNGWVSQNQCARGNQKSDLMENILPSLNTLANEEHLEEATITTEGQTSYTDPITHDSYFVIKGLRGTMLANHSMISSFAVKLWIRNGENDETIDENELIYNGDISIINSAVSLNGNFVNDFSSDLYTTSITNEKRLINFLGGDLKIRITLPSDVSIDDVVVIGETDGYANDNAAKLKIQQTTETAIQNNEIKFNIYPNPSNKEFTIEYTLKNTENAIVKINLYNAEGKHIKLISNVFLKRDENLNIKLSEAEYSLNAGTYFIVVDDGKNKYLKKIIKE